MNIKTELQKVNEEIARFIYGKYIVDQVGNGKDEVKFQCGDVMIAKILIHKDGYDFYINNSPPITVRCLKELETVKEIILQTNKPNRKPFPKENIVLCRNGDRCDLCYQYAHSIFTDEFHKKLAERAGRLYNYEPDYSRNCPGGYKGISCGVNDCAKGQGLEGCPDCANYPCGKTGQVSCGIDASSISADDITWLILPFVDGQYGN